MVSKALQLLSLLPRRPVEFCERVAAKVETRWGESKSGMTAYLLNSQEEAVSRLSSVLGRELDASLREAELNELRAQIGQQKNDLPSGAPFARFHNGGSSLGRFCYAITRALQPKIVLETGVCYGVTSAHFLKALELNGHGSLHSIDLPPLGKDEEAYVGSLVPRKLRKRWILHRGTTRRLLAPLLEGLGQIDLFLHDSLHTYANMRMEFAAAWTKLRAGGVLISDDVEGNRAFLDLAGRSDVVVSLVVREEEKGSLFGIAVKRR